MDNTLEHSRMKRLSHRVYCSRVRSRTTVFAGSEYCYARVIVKIQRRFKIRSGLESDECYMIVDAMTTIDKINGGTSVHHPQEQADWIPQTYHALFVCWNFNN